MKKEVGAAPTRGEMIYALGPRSYTPRTEANERAWESVRFVLANAPHPTREMLCAVLAQHWTYKAQNHYDFIDYLVRRKSLVVVEPE